MRPCFTPGEALRRAPRYAELGIAWFEEPLPGACSIVQVDVARVGGITPWLKVAHMAEAFNLAVCPHFLIELHVSLTAAAPAATWLEYIPQLDAVASSRLLIEDGMAVAPEAPGLGIAWRDDELDRCAAARHLIQTGT